MECKIIQTLKDDKYIYFDEKIQNIISIFDHVYYDPSDIDIINPAQRKYIINKLSSLSPKWTSGSQLSMQNTDKKITFARCKHRELNSIEFEKIMSNIKNDDLYFFTPTQYIYLILKYNLMKKEEFKDFLENYFTHSPINFRKIYHMDLGKDHFFYEFYFELKKKQEDIIKNTDLKFKRLK